MDSENPFARMLKDEMESAGLAATRKFVSNGAKLSTVQAPISSSVICPSSKLNDVGSGSSASILKRALQEPTLTSSSQIRRHDLIAKGVGLSSSAGALPPLRKINGTSVSIALSASHVSGFDKSSSHRNILLPNQTSTQGIAKNKSAFKIEHPHSSSTALGKKADDLLSVNSEADNAAATAANRKHLPLPKSDVSHILRVIAGSTGALRNLDSTETDEPTGEKSVSTNSSPQPMPLQNIAALPPSQLFAQWCAEHAGSPFSAVGGSSASPSPTGEGVSPRNRSRQQTHAVIETSLSSRNAAIALHRTVEQRLGELFSGADADDAEEPGLEQSTTAATSSPFTYPNVKPKLQRISKADRARRIRRVYDDAAYEIIRQISVHCAERARLLAYVWVSSSDALSNLTDRFALQDENHKKDIKKLQLALARANTAYETLSKFVCDSANEEGLARIAIMDKYFALEKRAQEAEASHRTELLHSKAAVAELLDENKKLKAKLLRRRDFYRAEGGFVFLRSPDGTRIVRRRKNELKRKGLYDDDPDVKITRANIAAVPKLDFAAMHVAKAVGSGDAEGNNNLDASASSLEVFHEPERRRERAQKTPKENSGDPDDTVLGDSCVVASETAVSQREKPNTVLIASNLMDVISTVFGYEGVEVETSVVEDDVEPTHKPIPSSSIDAHIETKKAGEDDADSNWSGDLRSPRDVLAEDDFSNVDYINADPALNYEEIEVADEAEDIIQTQLTEIFKLRLRSVDLTHEIEKLRDHEQLVIFRHQGVNTNIVETRDIGITASPNMAVGGGGGGVRRHRK